MFRFNNGAIIQIDIAQKFIINLKIKNLRIDLKIVRPYKTELQILLMTQVIKSKSAAKRLLVGLSTPDSNKSSLGNNVYHGAVGDELCRFLSALSTWDLNKSTKLIALKLKIACPEKKFVG